MPLTYRSDAAPAGATTIDFVVQVVETNTREHFAVYGFQEIPFSVECRALGAASDFICKT